MVAKNNANVTTIINMVKTMSDFISHPNNNVIQVIDKTSQSILAQFPPAENQKAYEKATELESYGLDVEIVQLGTPESFVHCLTNRADELNDYAQSVHEEWSSHD